MTLETDAASIANKAQSPLPFDERDLLAVRLLPAEFSRVVGVSKQTVSRWIRDEKVTLGADGRLDPTKAFRQLLRTGNPGRIRARLVRQAFADMADLRAQAARANELALQVAALVESKAIAELDADREYDIIDNWLRIFAAEIANAPASVRAELDEAAWRAYVSAALLSVMTRHDIHDFDDPDGCTEVAAGEGFQPRAFENEEGAGESDE